MYSNNDLLYVFLNDHLNSKTPQYLEMLCLIPSGEVKDYLKPPVNASSFKLVCTHRHVTTILLINLEIISVTRYHKRDNV